MPESGATINYPIFITDATGIIKTNNKTLFKENSGIIELRKKWCESISHRLRYVKRKASTAKPIIAANLILELGLSFYNEIKEIVQAHKILAKTIINVYQTPLPFLLISNYTLAGNGTSRVSILSTSDYSQIIGTFSVTIASDLLTVG